MSEHWPGTTGLPQSGTHRVVRGDRRAPDTWEYLKEPDLADAPEYRPQWTLYPGEGGVWTEADAEQLAEMHRIHLSAPTTVWTVPLPPRDL